MAGPAKRHYFGIQPYIDQSVIRIERYFGDVKETDALVIGVFGEWGAGKSTLLSAVAERFPNKPVSQQGTIDGRGMYPTQTITVEFNPWRFERETHLLVPLLKTASKVLSDYVAARLKEKNTALDPLQKMTQGVKNATGGKPWQWLKNRATTLANCTVALTKMVEIKAGIPGFGEVTLKPHDALEAAQKQIDRGEAKQSSAKPPINFESLYYDLHNELHKVTRGELDDDQKLNFLFLVDDIDRCLPDKAVEMLEAIKLFLDIPGCAFVLALDDEVVERGIAHRYRDYLDLTDRAAESIAYSLKPERFEQYRSRYSGVRLPPITGHEYLEKIVQLPFRLPRWSKEEMREFLRATFPEMFSNLKTPRPSTLPEHVSNSEETEGVPNVIQRQRFSKITNWEQKQTWGRTLDSASSDWLLELFVQAVPPVPRKIVRAVELLKFMREVAAARVTSRALDSYTLAQIVLLQLFAPQLFRFLRRERREAWLTLWRRIDESRKPATPAPPGYTTRSFFDWWEKRCAEDKKKPNPSPYTERVEEPFIAELRHAVVDRSGFDPRNLFLLDQEQKVDERLDVYFTLFEAPLATPTRATRTLEQVSVTPREPSAFISQLLGTNRDEWLNAINREEGLREAVLDETIFAQLLAEIKTKNFHTSTEWLEIALPILSFDHIRRLYRETGLIARLAEKAGMPITAKGTT
jgi:KAP family P-loop domain